MLPPLAAYGTPPTRLPLIVLVLEVAKAEKDDILGESSLDHQRGLLRIDGTVKFLPRKRGGGGAVSRGGGGCGHQ